MTSENPAPASGLLSSARLQYKLGGIELFLALECRRKLRGRIKHAVRVARWEMKYQGSLKIFKFNIEIIIVLIIMIIIIIIMVHWRQRAGGI
jgi:hypothetical protein